jgi:hypothetical protein
MQYQIIYYDSGRGKAERPEVMPVKKRISKEIRGKKDEQWKEKNEPAGKEAMPWPRDQ